MCADISFWHSNDRMWVCLVYMRIVIVKIDAPKSNLLLWLLPWAALNVVLFSFALSRASGLKFESDFNVKMF